MYKLNVLIRRNMKLFFKDRAMFLTSLVTPVILLVLYAVFLRSVYRSSLEGSLPVGIVIPDALLDALTAGQLISSILAVSCVTVSFCANFIMVQDKVTGNQKDLTMAPVSRPLLSAGYFGAAFLSSAGICMVALGVCLVYVAAEGWYMEMGDVLLLAGDVLLLSLFGTALSSLIHFFLSTQGQISAVCTVISAGYGFLCGAYMPISSFGPGLQKALLFFPGTYGTSLVRNHSMTGVLEELERQGVPGAVTDSFRKALDCSLFFDGNPVSIPTMYAVLGVTAAVLAAIYVIMNYRILSKTGAS